MIKLSNHELAKRYEEKSRLLGKQVLDLNYMSDDRVELVEVLDKEDRGRIVIPRFITDIDKAGVFYGCEYSDIYIDNNDSLKDVERLCAGLLSNKVRLSFRDSSKIESMVGLFDSSQFLEGIDISGINMRGVRSVKNMFNGCEALKCIDISNMRGESLEDMSGMFMDCDSLEYIKFNKKLDTSKVEDMSKLFYGCMGLKELDVSVFNTKNVVSMESMFSWCMSLMALDVSNFNTSNVVSMEFMFSNCMGLWDLNLSNFDLSKIRNDADIAFMFDNCSKMLKVRGLERYGI